MASLSGRYILIFLLILVLPVFLLGVVLDIRYFSRLRESAIEQMQDLVDQVAGTLDTEISQIQILSAALINNFDFLKTCEDYTAAADDRERNSLRLELDRHLTDVFSYTNKIGTVYLFFPDRELFYYHNYPTNRPVLNVDRTLILPALDRKGINHVIPDLKGVNPVEAERPMLSIAVSPGESYSRHGLEAVIVSFRIGLLDMIDQGRGPAGRASMVVASGDGRVLLASPAEAGLAPAVTAAGGLRDGLVVQDDGSAYLVSSSGIASTDWRVFRAVDYKGFIRPLRRARWFTYVSFGLLSIFFILYTLLFFRGMVRPLRTVIHRMEIVASGDYGAQVPVEGPSEFAALGTAFNRMTSEIRRLTAEAGRKEREKTRYEMEALQYRIHPHFVANTLNSIRLMAEAEGNGHISEMSASLMRLVTESFNEGGRTISLGDEIRNLESYIHIMRVRFGELIDVAYDIPRELESMVILKMLLQPIVENAVLHGIRETDRPGRIAIAAGISEKALSITIEDNGAGADQARLARCLEEPAPSSGRGFTRIGIFNVHRRIQLNYGPEYGLSVESRIGEGTVVTLRLPAEAEGDGDA